MKKVLLFVMSCLLLQGACYAADGAAAGAGAGVRAVNVKSTIQLGNILCAPFLERAKIVNSGKSIQITTTEGPRKFSIDLLGKKFAANVLSLLRQNALSDDDRKKLIAQSTVLLGSYWYINWAKPFVSTLATLLTNEEVFNICKCALAFIERERPKITGNEGDRRSDYKIYKHVSHLLLLIKEQLRHFDDVQKEEILSTLLRAPRFAAVCKAEDHAHDMEMLIAHWSLLKTEQQDFFKECVVKGLSASETLKKEVVYLLRQNALSGDDRKKLIAQPTAWLGSYWYSYWAKPFVSTLGRVFI